MHCPTTPPANARSSELCATPTHPSLRAPLGAVQGKRQLCAYEQLPLLCSPPIDPRARERDEYVRNLSNRCIFTACISKAAICPGNPYPGISRIAGGRSRISVREYPSRRRTSYLVDGCHERGPRSTARCTASSWYSHKCASIRFGRAPIWRLHGGSTTANHERRLSSRSAAGPPQREP